MFENNDHRPDGRYPLRNNDIGDYRMVGRRLYRDAPTADAIASASTTWSMR
jgi:hypothetical protein